LYPCRQWLLKVGISQKFPESLKVLERALEKPSGLMLCIHSLTESPTAETIKEFYETVKTFQPWSDHPYSWPAQFMLDSELNWVDGRTPVDDL